jgi:hypothetical protein
MRTCVPLVIEQLLREDGLDTSTTLSLPSTARFPRIR